MWGKNQIEKRGNTIEYDEFDYPRGVHFVVDQIPTFSNLTYQATHCNHRQAVAVKYDEGQIDRQDHHAFQGSHAAERVQSKESTSYRALFAAS